MTANIITGGLRINSVRHVRESIQDLDLHGAGGIYMRNQMDAFAQRFGKKVAAFAPRGKTGQMKRGFRYETDNPKHGEARLHMFVEREDPRGRPWSYIVPMAVNFGKKGQGGLRQGIRPFWTNATWEFGGYKGINRKYATWLKNAFKIQWGESGGKSS